MPRIKLTPWENLQAWSNYGTHLLNLSPRLLTHSWQYPDKQQYWQSIKNTYYANLINLNLALRQTHDEAEVYRIARKTIYAYLSNAIEWTFPEHWPECRWINDHFLTDSMQEGKGVIVASQHVGPQRFAFLELANRSYTVQALLSENALARIEPWISYITQHLRAPKHRIDGEKIAQYFHLIVAERPGSALKLVRALKRKEIVMLNLDGNTGSGGEEGTLQGTSTVTFLGKKIHVRRGAAFLSYKTGAPIVPMMPLWNPRGYPQLTFYEPLRPNAEETLDDFCQRSLTHLYQLLESYLRDYPEQWEMWPDFYKWMNSTNKAGAGLKSIVKERLMQLQQALTAQQDLNFQVATQRACVLKIKERYVLLDLLGFRFFMVSARTQELMSLLHQGTTLQQLVAHFQHKYSVDQILAEIAQLLALHILPSERETSPQP